MGCSIMCVQDLGQFAVMVLHPVSLIHNHVSPAHLISNKNTTCSGYIIIQLINGGHFTPQFWHKISLLIYNNILHVKLQN